MSKSPYGLTGNGFDFQIKPWIHGGGQASVTSVPYPVLAEEALDGRVEGAFNIKLIQNLEAFDPVMPQATSGTMRDILQSYHEGPESIDSIMAVAQSGTIDAILIVVSIEPDTYDAVMARARDGAMRRILIEITMDTDSFNGVTAVATGGTMH